MSYSRILFLGALLIVFCTPLSSLDASVKPAKIKTSCVLKVVSFEGESVIQKETTKTIRSSSGKKVTCLIVPHTVSGDIDITSTVLRSAKKFFKPTISGTASGTKTVKLSVSDEAGTKQLYKKTVKVKNGKWKAEISTKLSNGNYKIEANALSSILTISTSSPSSIGTNSATTFVVGLIPLLSGGVARANDTVPVSYLQVTNVGNESATLKGFWLKQNGSASVQSVIGFTAIDDTGFITGSTNITEGITPFNNGLAYAPINATFGPNQMRLFTIKAVLGRNIFSDLGRQLAIDLTSIDTTSGIRGSFPIRGTTWTIVN